MESEVIAGRKATILLSQITIPVENHGYDISVSALETHSMNRRPPRSSMEVGLFASVEKDGPELCKCVGNKERVHLQSEVVVV